MIRRMGVFQRENRGGPRWYGQWRVNGKRVTRALPPKVKTRAQAEKVWLEVEEQRVRGKLGLLDNSQATLGELRAAFLEAKAPHLAPKSIDRYDVCLRMLAETVGDGCLVRNLTSRKLSWWAAQRLQQGVSAAGVNCDLRHIRAALNWAAAHELTEAAPKVQMVRASKPLPRHLDPEKIKSLLAAAPPERRRLWLFFLWTGCRRSEVRGLRWEHVSWEPHPVARVTGKGDKERAVPLLPMAVAAMAGIVAPDGECCPYPRPDLGQVWPNCNADNYTRWFQKDSRAAKLTGARLHDLRHTAITYMISRGVPVRVVQDIAGHESITTTEGYSRALVTDLYEQLSKGL